VRGMQIAETVNVWRAMHRSGSLANGCHRTAQRRSRDDIKDELLGTDLKRSDELPNRQIRGPIGLAPVSLQPRFTTLPGIAGDE